jgi:predicted metal-dependent hydrolase
MAEGAPRSRCGERPSTELLRGIEQFNQRELFEAHETLEALWLAEHDDVRYLYQGILQVGVGYYHLLRGNHHGAVAKLHSGAALLEFFLPTCQGVDVSSIVDAARRHRDELQRLGPERLDQFDLSTIPTIGVATETGAQ